MSGKTWKAKPTQPANGLYILSTLCSSQLHELLVHELGHFEVTQKVFLCYSALSSADKLVSGTSHKCKVGLTFWVSPTFLMHSVQLLYYNGFLHQKILQNMIELKIQQGCRTHPRSLHHFLRKWYYKKGTIWCWIRSSLQLPLLWNSQAEHMS